MTDVVYRRAATADVALAQYRRAAGPQAEICLVDDGYHFLPGQGARVLALVERSRAPDAVIER